MSDFAGGFGGACWLGDLSGQVCKPMQDLLPARLHPKLLQNKIPDFQQQGGNAGPEVDANDLVTFHEATPESNESARHRTEFEDVAHAGCMPHQQPIFDSIYNKRAGIVALSGAGGAGKSHLLKCLTHKYRETGCMVSISATTARAARNLSVFGVLYTAPLAWRLNLCEASNIWHRLEKTYY